MRSAQSFRVGGLALLTGAVAFSVHILARSAITAGAGGATITFASDGLWVPVNALGLIGAVLVLMAMPAMYARTADSSGLLGLIGVVLIAFGWLFFGLFLTFYSMVVLPWLAKNAPLLVDGLDQHPPMLVAYAAALLAEVVGVVLFAIPFVRTHGYPHWIGYALLASALMTVGGIFIAPGGPATNLAINLLSNLGPVLLMIAFGALGARMWAEHVSTDHAHVRVQPSAA